STRISQRRGAFVERPTVLIVDDEPRVLDALEAILAAEFPVVRASHGDEALAVLERQEVAVILTDHRMPGMTGVELLRRSQDMAPHAIRIVLTAFTDVDNLMEAINTGRIYHFIPKPWDPNELLVVVRRAAERYELARENARLRDELELACNAMQREASAARERPLSLEKLVGAQSGLRSAVELARRVLESDTTVQVRLLRVLQEGEIRRVGTSSDRKVNVRVIAATNADLEAEVRDGRFRKDLYYRLDVFPIRLPPLRERSEDIPALADYFLRLYRQRARRAVPSISAEALRCPRAYPFPGTVRRHVN